jgi:hypothetical protein
MKIRILLLLFCFIGCKNSQPSQLMAVNIIQVLNDGKGLFTGTLNNKEYSVSVDCSYVNEDYFQFRSDDTDIFDSNGDGLVISGYQRGEKLAITIIDHDQAYSTASTFLWDKRNTKISGTGKLLLEGSAKSYELFFKITCK